MPKAWAGCDQLTGSILFEVLEDLVAGITHQEIPDDFPYLAKEDILALFLGHLVLEKLLKAHYVKTLGKHAIFTHDLLRLATKTGVNLTEEVQE